MACAAWVWRLRLSQSARRIAHLAAECLNQHWCRPVSGSTQSTLAQQLRGGVTKRPPTHATYLRMPCVFPSVPCALAALHLQASRAHRSALTARVSSISFTDFTCLLHSLVACTLSTDAQLILAQKDTADIPALRGCCSSSDRARVSVASSKTTPQPAQSRLDSSLMGIMYASGSFFAPWLASLFTKLMKSTSYTASGMDRCEEIGPGNTCIRNLWLRMPAEVPEAPF